MVFYDIINKWLTTSGTKLDTRMRGYVKTHNHKQCHGFKPFIVTLKSRGILNYLNGLAEFDDKVCQLETIQDVLFNASKGLYKIFDPNLIYTFENEINVVFFYNDSGIYLFDGNVNRLITSISSYMSIEVYKEMMKVGIDLDSSFSAQFVEFDIDYEVLNYLVWRQMDCRRNTITLLYKCMNIDAMLDGNHIIEKVRINNMIEDINEKYGKDKIGNLNHLLTGSVIKKYVFYKVSNKEWKKTSNRKSKKLDSKDNTEGIVTRKSVGVEHFFFSDNFKSNLQKYVINKVY
jgi:tRNA(His) 5'-end guanylyltransferase